MKVLDNQYCNLVTNIFNIIIYIVIITKVILTRIICKKNC